MKVDAGRHLLARAAAQAGGVSVLASQLGLSERVLRHYIEGNEPVPDSLVLQVVDVILKRLPEPPKN